MFFFNEGVTLISLALCADAIIGNVQEKAMKQFGSSNSEMVILLMFHIAVYRFADRSKNMKKRKYCFLLLQ